MATEPPVPVDPPVPSEEGPPNPGEVEMRRLEASSLEEVGRLPESSPTQQLVQMATKAWPSMSGGKEPARKKC